MENKEKEENIWKKFLEEQKTAWLQGFVYGFLGSFVRLFWRGFKKYPKKVLGIVVGVFTVLLLGSWLVSYIKLREANDIGNKQYYELEQKIDSIKLDSYAAGYRASQRDKQEKISTPEMPKEEVKKPTRKKVAAPSSKKVEEEPIVLKETSSEPAKPTTEATTATSEEK